MKRCLMPPPPQEELCPRGADPRAAELLNKMIYFHKLEGKVMYKLVASREIFHAQLLYLRIIARDEGLTHSQLAQRMGVERASVSTAVQRMEKAGLLERRSDPKDQRLSRIYLTERGRRMNEETEKEMAEYINRCFSIGEELSDAMLRGLELLADNMQTFIFGDEER